MTRKFDLSWRIGMAILLLCTTLILTVLPAAADYTADNELVTYAQGTITGDMNYTIGDSYYSPKMWSNGSYTYTTNLPQAVPADPDVEDIIGRLYVYWTWSYNATDGVNQGVNPIMNVTFNGAQLTREIRYYDSKGFDPYNYPSGTDCYNILDYNNDLSTNIVNITNAYGSAYSQSFNIQAVGLLTLYNNSNSNVQKNYWIDEGCDLTYTKWNATSQSWEYNLDPENTTCTAHFSNVNNNSVNSATLITVAPSAGTQYNRLYLNNNHWDGVWDGSPRDSNFSWNTTNVLNCLNDGQNNVKFRNGLENDIHYTDGQMEASNAFLLVTY